MERGNFVSTILKGNAFALLDDGRKRTARPNLLFYDLVEWVKATSIEEARDKLNGIDEHIKAGFFAVGCYSYELGYALIERLSSLYKEDESTPLFYVGIFRKRIEISNEELDAALDLATEGDDALIFDCRLNMSKQDYLGKLDRIKNHIIDGDTYQVNYTLKYTLQHRGSSFYIYKMLRRSQIVSYGAFLKFPEFSVLSRSPELFFEKNGDTIFTKPMKGTCQRGADKEQDLQNFAFLSNDEKSRAENVMIVDLLRNDLSKICRKGSVRASNLFEVLTFETLHQMISTVSGRIEKNSSLHHIFSHIFPCGSITGAPKLRTMEIINELETEQRGVYTGAIGYVSPDNNMCFSVPIRTLVLRPDGTGEMGVGSGVVHDSDAEAEYDECLLKALFLTNNIEDCKLIESLLFDNQYPHLERHLSRLSSSAKTLGFDVNIEKIRSALVNKSTTLTNPSKVRLSLDRSGLFNISSEEIVASNEEKKIIVVNEKVNSGNVLLKHKTSKRNLYNDVYARESKRGYYDAIFTNELGQITEGTFNNIFVRKGEFWYTPPLSSGLLGGIQRQSLLESREIQVFEMFMTPLDLEAADEIYLTNAVRGVTRVTLALTVEERACSY